jgi:hypothetical protein
LGTISPTELLRLWKLEQVTLEMAIGYLIQNQAKLDKAIQAANISRSGLRADVDRLIAHTKMERKQQGKNMPLKKS